MDGRISRFIILISLASVCLLGAGCHARPGSAAEGPAEPAMRTDAERTPAPEAAKSAAPVQTPEPVGTPEPASEPAPEPTPEPEPEDTYTGPDLDECEAVDDAFFADAAFLGNSLVDGLRRHGGLSEGSFFAATSASVVNVDTTKNCALESGARSTLITALTEKQYAKIYILLGINEIGFDVDYFSQLYGAMLDRIIELEPGADVYIMSLSPITEERSGYRDVFNMERVESYNEALYALAQEKECYYIDLCQALAGEDGFLPEEDSTDGIHLKPEKYPQWADYLRTHVKR